MSYSLCNLEGVILSFAEAIRDFARRYAEVFALYLVLAILLAAGRMFFDYPQVARAWGVAESRALPMLVFVEGLLAIAAVGLAFFAYGYRTHGSLSGRTRIVVQSAIVTVSAAVVFITLFSTAMALVPPAVKAEPAAQRDERIRGAVVWTQFGLGERPEIIVRALIENTAECPRINVGDGAHVMRLREDPRAAIFGRMCERRVPWRNKDVKIEVTQAGKVLLGHTVTPEAKTILVMGDTGCRIASYDDQGCHADSTWPFGLVAESAARKPADLIIHVGDYFYRETPCNGASVDCRPRPFGDRQESWRIDFFEPARNLLPRAPWIFVRGNHEDCSRGGYGWFYYFGDSAKACETLHETTYLTFADLLIVHFDTAHADDPYAYKDTKKKWDDLSRAVSKGRIAAAGDARTSVPVLLLTHKPAYILCNEKKLPTSGCDIKREGAEKTANMGGVRNIVDEVQRANRRTIILGGDVHTFQVLDLIPAASRSDETVTQIVIGNGGSSLDSFPAAAAPPILRNFTFQHYRLHYHPITEEWVHKPLDDPLAAATQVWPAFGFGTLLLGSGGVELAAYDVHGNRQFICDLGSTRRRSDVIAPPSAPAGPAPAVSPPARCR